MITTDSLAAMTQLCLARSFGDDLDDEVGEGLLIL
jgi:hypothetical protein